jgi:hypothetical protein
MALHVAADSYPFYEDGGTKTVGQTSFNYFLNVASPSTPRTLKDVQL